MTDMDFETGLDRAFRDPAPGVDTAALERAIIRHVERADRQRRLVLFAAAVLGSGIAAGAAFGSGLVALVRDGWRALEALELQASGESSVWLFALVGVLVFASSIVRAARDA